MELAIRTEVMSDHQKELAKLRQDFNEEVAALRQELVNF